MNRLPLFILASTLVLSLSCKKDTVVAEPKLNSYASSLQIGGQQVTVTDFTNTAIQELDVDNDGWADFVIDVNVTTGGSISFVYDVLLVPVHQGASVLYHIPNDTIFSGTVVSITGTTPISHRTYTYSGPEHLPGTSLHWISDIKVSDYKSLNDVIQSSNSFTSETVKLDHHRITQYYNVTNTTADTTYSTGFYIEELGDYYGSEPFRFVGFKISEGNGVERLGWIKLKISNYYQVEVFQMGIQDPL